MSIDKLKTKFFTGAWLTDVKHYFTKINEIIDHLNGVGKSGDGSYKEYTFKASQLGINNPPTVDYEGVNTLGTATFSYDSLGTYLITIPGAFPDYTKVFVFFGDSDSNVNIDGTINPGVIKSYYNDVNSLGIQSYVFKLSETLPINQGMLSDSLLKNQIIKIIVYN